MNSHFFNLIWDSPLDVCGGFAHKIIHKITFDRVEVTIMVII